MFIIEKNILKKLSKKTVLLVAAMLAVSGTVSAKGDSSPVEMAKKLAALRQEVDVLSTSLEDKKEEFKGRIRSYSTQKAELEAQIQRAKIRQSALDEQIKKRVDKVNEQVEMADVLTPAVLESIGILKKEIEKSIPFKRKERIEELDRLISQMDQKILHPANCYARLWDRTEDEFRLSKESGVYKQVIVLDGKEILADVVRIGMVMIYFETKEGVVGKSVYSDNKWSFQKIYNQKEKKEVLYLFDSFKKQVRTGLFVLPSAIPEGER